MLNRKADINGVFEGDVETLALVSVPVEYRDFNCSLHSCMSVLLHLHGIEITTDRAISLAPVPIAAMSESEFRTVLDNFGVTVTTNALRNTEWLLAVYEPNYTLLIRHLNDGKFYLAIPGQSTRMIASESIEGIRIHARMMLPIALREFPLALKLPLTRPYWWLLNFPKGKSEPLQRRTNTRVVSHTYREHSGLRLRELSIVSLCQVHRQLAPQSENLGLFRTFRLSRGGIVFLEHQKISDAIDALIAYSKSAIASLPLNIEWVLKLFVDFLSIHPFSNGNGRIAKAIVDFLLEPIGVVQWELLSRSELYFWTNQAQLGNISKLTAGISRVFHARNPMLPISQCHTVNNELENGR